MPAGARWRHGYEPFGAKRTSEKLNTVAEDPQLGFSGTYLESTTGNYHLRARDLHPWGMFLSPDPLSPDINDPYITAYAYANQRPTLLTDPSGLTPGLPGWLQEGLVGAYGGLIETGAQLPGGQQLNLAVSLATGQSQSEWYYEFTSDYYGIDGTSTASQIGSATAPALIPVGGGTAAACRLLEAERFGFALSKIGAPPVAKVLPSLRQAYVSEVAGLSGREAAMRAAGASTEDIARALHAERRALGVKYKDLTPEPMLSEIYARNLQKYGDKLGPSIDYLLSRGKSWEDIIESATRTGGKDLGF